MRDDLGHTRLRFRLPERVIGHDGILSSRCRSLYSRWCDILLIIVFPFVSTTVFVLRVFVFVVLPLLIMALAFLMVVPERGLFFVSLWMGVGGKGRILNCLVHSHRGNRVRTRVLLDLFMMISRQIDKVKHNKYQ